MIHPTISQVLNTSTFAEVTLPAGQGAKTVSLWTEDGASYEMSTTSAGTDATVVPDGLPLSLDLGGARMLAGTTICFAKGTTVTNLVGLLTK